MIKNKTKLTNHKTSTNNCELIMIYLEEMLVLQYLRQRRNIVRLLLKKNEHRTD